MLRLFLRLRSRKCDEYSTLILLILKYRRSDVGLQMSVMIFSHVQVAAWNQFRRKSENTSQALLIATMQG